VKRVEELLERERAYGSDPSYLRGIEEALAVLRKDAFDESDPCISDPSHQFHTHDEDEEDATPE